jgi:hypothetical protein
LGIGNFLSEKSQLTAQVSITEHEIIAPQDIQSAHLAEALQYRPKIMMG